MKNKQTLILVIVLIVLIILSAGFIGYTIFTKHKEEQEVSSMQGASNEKQEEAPIVVEEKEIEIFKRK